CLIGSQCGLNPGAGVRIKRDRAHDEESNAPPQDAFGGCIHDDDLLAVFREKSSGLAFHRGMTIGAHPGIGASTKVTSLSSVRVLLSSLYVYLCDAPPKFAGITSGSRFSTLMMSPVNESSSTCLGSSEFRRAFSSSVNDST